MLDGVAEQPLAHPHGRGIRCVAVADRHLELDHLGGVVHQGDAEGAVVDHALGQVGDAGEQLLEIEDRAHLAAGLGQRLHSLGVVLLRGEEAGVGQRLGDGGGEHAQDLLVVGIEGVEVVAEQVERAQHLPLVAQRHDQRRQGARRHRDVARIGAHVVHQDGVPLGHRGADHALARREPHRLRRILGIALGVGDTQLLRRRRRAGTRRTRRTASAGR